MEHIKWDSELNLKIEYFETVTDFSFLPKIWLKILVKI